MLDKGGTIWSGWGPEFLRNVFECYLIWKVHNIRLNHTPGWWRCKWNKRCHSHKEALAIFQENSLDIGLDLPSCHKISLTVNVEYAKG
jgi:hypothetical protein